MRKVRMKNGERPSLFLIALLSLSCILGIFGRSAGVGVEAASTVVSVFPAVTDVSSGAHFTVEIRVAGALSVYAWLFRLAWNTAVLNATTASNGVFEGGFLKAGGQTFFLNETFLGEGYMYVGCTLLGDLPGVSGDGTLATVEFVAVGPGQTLLDLSESSYYEVDGQVIVHLSAAASEQTTSALGSAAVNPRPQPSQDPVWRVPQDFPTIQAAISSSSVHDGDTIHVSAGTYNENVVVSKSLTILGQGRATTTIRASTALTARPTVRITARNVRIGGFRIEGRFAGVLIGFVAGSATIFNTYITNIATYTNFVGLVSFGSGSHWVRSNEIFDNVAGMLLFRSSANQIIANNVTHNSAVGTQIVLGLGGNTIYWNNFGQPAGVPNALVWMAAANTWENTAMQKGNFWNQNVPGWGPSMNPTNVDNYPRLSFWIPITGDVNLDGTVNILDISAIAFFFGTRFSDTRWSPVADLTGDGQVNILDLAKAARNWGQTDP